MRFYTSLFRDESAQRRVFFAILTRDYYDRIKFIEITENIFRD